LEADTRLVYCYWSWSCGIEPPSASTKLSQNLDPGTGVTKFYERDLERDLDWDPERDLERDLDEYLDLDE